jgi:hypothetical protein
MADALRFRVAASARPYAATMDAARFQELANVEETPATARPGALAPLVRLSRRMIHALVRPWLATQTLFNRELARRLDHALLVTGDLDRRLPHLERSLQRLEARILQLEATAHEGRSSAAGGARPASIDLATLTAMFVHGRMPRPPARVLAVRAGAALATELASFGFLVCSLDDAQEGHPRVLRCHASLESLPFADASLDAVVGALPLASAPESARVRTQTLEEIWRVLRPGGRFVGALEPGGAAGREGLGPALAPLHLHETAHARFDGSAWTVRAVDAAADGRSTPAAVAALTLIDARRPDVSGR